jgi:hypothetical protein
MPRCQNEYNHDDKDDNEKRDSLVKRKRRIYDVIIFSILECF